MARREQRGSGYSKSRQAALLLQRWDSCPVTFFLIRVLSTRISYSLIGYYASILTIEKLGRKWIQIQGFLAAAFFRKLLPSIKVLT
jgi:hypothetical protein